MLHSGATCPQLSPTDSVLDIGFGDGRVVVAAALCGHQAIGVENSPQLVSRAQLVASRCQLSCTSLAAFCAAHPTDAAHSDFVASGSAAPLASPRRTERALAAANRTVSAIKQVNAERKALASGAEASAAVATGTADVSPDQSASPAIADSTAPESIGTATLVLEQLDVADAALTRDILPRVTAVFLYMLPVRVECLSLTWHVLFISEVIDILSSPPHAHTHAQPIFVHRRKSTPSSGRSLSSTCLWAPACIRTLFPCCRNVRRPSPSAAITVQARNPLPPTRAPPRHAAHFSGRPKR